MQGDNGAARGDARGRRHNRRGQGERLREELLGAASRLVDERGGAGALSLRAVAAGVGVTATSIYLHFGNMDELKVALVQRWFAEFLALRDIAVTGIADPARSLIVRCQTYARYGLDHPGRYRLMFGPDLPAQVSFGGRDSPSRAALDALVESTRRCQQAGAAPADDPTRLAMLVWTALHGQVSLRLDRPLFPWPPLDATVAELVARIVRLETAL